MSWFLEHIDVKRYGGMENRRIGPFSPGLNVVFGPNEAGKTTVASLVGGVLFGWEDAHGVRNTYRPPQGERSGALGFSEANAAASPLLQDALAAPQGVQAASEGAGEPTAPGSEPTAPGSATVASSSAAAAPAAPEPSAAAGEVWLSRTRNEDGIQGPKPLVSDLDRSTFQSLFSLTSDELRTLRNTSDVTARLLAAGSGTGSSPSGAFVEIEQLIAEHTSLAAEAEHSAVLLARQVDEKQDQIRRATEAAELSKQQDRELRELSLDRADAAARIETLNRELEDYAAWRAELSSIDEKSASFKEEVERLGKERASLAEAHGAGEPFDSRLLQLDGSAERGLRDQIDEYAEAREKAARIVDTAKENSTTSAAAYEALVELDQDGSTNRSLKSRTLFSAISVIPTLAFIGAGVALFVYGRRIGSLSFTALGIGLTVLAFFLAAAAIVVLFRPARGEDAIADRQKDAQWVMLQDRKKLDSSLADAAQLEEEIARFLQEAGLGAANGSLRQARSLLDDARDFRAQLAAEDQRIASIDLRMRSLEADLEALAATRRQVECSAGLAEGATLREVDEQLKEKSAQRDALLEVADGMSMRFGELSQSLQQARQDRTLDTLKLEHQMLRTRLRQAKHELVELLLAKRMLERGIAMWESRNQPEVYAEASRLLALITGGAWVQVSMSMSGSIVVKNAAGETLKPRHLSLGTCQQLYLALRIALLLSADNVGRAIPVMADDILVNFDAARRLGAARALAELAAHRQVIVFTCHEETVAALRDATPNVNYLEL